ncbi:MAG: cysteine desulfurase [Elusimicrobia bacterium]|nr:cysteine desulfurase [Elusimicrobiota bacterium]
MIDIKAVRSDFPALNQKVYGKDLIYLDNAATTHKPLSVMDRLVDFYSTINSNVHRGSHYLSTEASIAYEGARESVRKFINAARPDEIIFTGGTTESINLAASSFGRAFVKEGDRILTTLMEHHSNIVPWQRLCGEKGAELKVIPIDDGGNLKIDEFKELITKKTKLVAFTYVSSVLGTVNPVREISRIAHENDIPVLVDGAQAPQHLPVDVRNLDCDFFAFSGHKVYAGTGIGVLYGKKRWLDAMEPYQSGGGMITSVSFESTSYEETPLKFEAGTGNIAGALGLESAIEYLNKIGIEKIAAYEKSLTEYALKKLQEVEGIRIYGSSKERCGVISFNLKGVHHHDLGTVLDKLGIAVRTGKLCAEPLMEYYGISGTVRVSFALYNTKKEVDTLIEGIEKARHVLQAG